MLLSHDINLSDNKSYLSFTLLVGVFGDPTSTKVPVSDVAAMWPRPPVELWKNGNFKGLPTSFPSRQAIV
jgi:hypothetical protein